MNICLWLWLDGGIDYRRQGSTDRDDPSGQQDDNEDDDEHDHHNDHDQLDVLPPVRASHFLRRLLEVLSLNREREERHIEWAQNINQPDDSLAIIGVAIDKRHIHGRHKATLCRFIWSNDMVIENCFTQNSTCSQGLASGWRREQKKRLGD